MMFFSSKLECEDDVCDCMSDTSVSSGTNERGLLAVDDDDDDDDDDGEDEVWLSPMLTAYVSTARSKSICTHTPQTNAY